MRTPTRSEANRLPRGLSPRWYLGEAYCCLWGFTLSAQARLSLALQFRPVIGRLIFDIPHSGSFSIQNFSTPSQQCQIRRRSLTDCPPPRSRALSTVSQTTARPCHLRHPFYFWPQPKFAPDQRDCGESQAQVGQNRSSQQAHTLLSHAPISTIHGPLRQPDCIAVAHLTCDEWTLYFLVLQYESRPHLPPLVSHACQSRQRIRRLS